MTSLLFWVGLKSNHQLLVTPNMWVSPIHLYRYLAMLATTVVHGWCRGVELLISSLWWNFIWHLLVLWKLDHRKEAFKLDPALTILVLCPKCVASSTAEACLQSLTVNPGVYWQAILFGSSLGLPWTTIWKDIFVSGTGVFSLWYLWAALSAQVV